jgi:hypothetical protein
VKGLLAYRHWVWMIHAKIHAPPLTTPPATIEPVIASQLTLPAWLTRLQFAVPTILIRQHSVLAAARRSGDGCIGRAAEVNDLPAPLRRVVAVARHCEVKDRLGPSVVLK